MKITVLIENGTCSIDSHNLKPEHGISLYIETQQEKILFDVGKSDRFYTNAQKLGIDISAVDKLFISHGHFDHGGGLQKFFEINNKAKVYMHRKAIGKYYAKLLGFIPVYIGLSRKIVTQYKDRFVFVEEDMRVADNIFVLQNFDHDFPVPKGNGSLYAKENKQWKKDMFRHEIVLVLKENDKHIVFTGCSHSGVINMYNKAKKYLNNADIKAVLGGFHIHNPVTKRNEPKDYLDRLRDELQQTEAVYYTGHCTGEKNFQYLKTYLGDQLQSMHTGAVIDL